MTEINSFEHPIGSITPKGFTSHKGWVGELGQGLPISYIFAKFYGKECNKF